MVIHQHQLDNPDLRRWAYLLWGLLILVVNRLGGVADTQDLNCGVHATVKRPGQTDSFPGTGPARACVDCPRLNRTTC